MNTIFSIVPRPRNIDFAEKFVAVSSGAIYGEDEFIDTAYLCAKQFSDSGLPCVVQKQKDIKDSVMKIQLIKDDSVVSKEGYILLINEDEIKIAGCAAQGVFYGFQTLRQLIMTAPCSSGAIQLPCCRIEDAPQYQWRGVMLDTCRNFFPVHFVKKLIDVASLHKLNRFHWHLTDDQGWRLYVPEYPLLAEIGGFRGNFRAKWIGKTGGFYTDEEIRDVVEYARQRYVTVVPEIESPGHALALLASYPGFGCTGGPYQVEQRFGIFDDVLCAGNDEIFKLYGAVYDTVCRLFPGEYLHMGGDECPRTNWKTCPKCQARIKSQGLAFEDELQSWMTVRFASMISERGKIPIGWDEVLDGTERLGLPQNVVVQSWRGIEGGIKAASMGHKVIMSPQTQGCYLDYKNYDDDTEPGWLNSAPLIKSYNYSPIPEGSGMNPDFVLGGQGNLWTEMIHASRIAEYMLFPRLCALSESLWLSSEQKDFESFSKRLESHKQRLDMLDIRYYRGLLS
ncbi:MAG: beta-N-acetylhexosaminidase [Spirochaetaceae bacterium]|nr:beta-N-acetylhexosaminidase [Spirochaetaceae bacterium]